MSQMNPRKKIELLKDEIRATLEHDALRYKRSIIREIDSLWRSYKNTTSNMSIDRFADYVFNFLRVPAGVRYEILADLKDTQTQIGSVWDEYFGSLLDSARSDTLGKNYEKLIATYSVDFKSIDSNTRDIVVKTFRESVNKDYSFETIRTNLLKTTINSNEVYTLANTAVSMYDNSTMFEYALQAGINRFLYDGHLQANSRIFCIEHFKKIYTYQQILQMDNFQGLPVVTSCGGYNCHHYWTAKI